MRVSYASGQIHSGLEAIKGAKVRSFWTMLGIIIGVASVISVIAIGDGIKQQVSGQIHHFGANLITVKAAQIEAGSGSSASDVGAISGLSVSGNLTAKDLKAVSHVPGVSSVSPLTLISGTVKADNGVYNKGYVIGASPELPGLLNQSVAYGNFFLDSDMGNQVAVLGQNAANAMFNENIPLGRSFTFHGQTFIVEGIFNEFNAAPLSQQADLNNAIFIPNDVAESLSNNTAPTYELLARASSNDETKRVAKNIQQALDVLHGGDSGFVVLTGNQNLRSNNDILSLLTKLIAGVAAISVLVAGIGIMNVMLVSVSERVREIGIRKAIGATNKQILNQFMIEAGLISLIGGLIGIAIAYAVDYSLRLFTSLQPIITWQIIVIAVFVSLLVGVLFGTIPAIKAARKDPIDALRAE